MEDLYYAYNPWWEKKSFDSGIVRAEYLKEAEKLFSRKQIEVIIGSRRVGKTTFLKQLIKRCLYKNVPGKSIIYLALDNPRLSKAALSEHLKLFRKIFMHSRGKKLFLFFDEVQGSPNWESELKSIYDIENVKIICTGSTSSLIKRQTGKLTGRQIVTKIYPLGFNEYLSFRKVIPLKSEDYKLEALLEEYMLRGGYPENVLNPSEEYLNNLIDDIIAKDVVTLYNIKRPAVLKDLLILLAASVGSRISFNKLSNILGIAVDTVKEYTGYLESSFLVQSLEKWSPSYTDRIYSQKKIYLYDTGIKSALTGKGDLGAKAENIVFNHLYKSQSRIGYFAESEKELDFVFGSFGVPNALEVKYESKINWLDKKFSGVKLFLKRYPEARKVIIISKNQAEVFKENKIGVEIIPAWKYLHDEEDFKIFDEIWKVQKGIKAKDAEKDISEAIKEVRLKKPRK